MRIDPGFKRRNLTVLLFDLRLKHPVDVQVQLVQHIVEAFGDLAQLILLHIGDTGIEIPVLHLAGKADNIMRPGGKIADEQRRGDHREQNADQANGNDHVAQTSVSCGELPLRHRTEHGKTALGMRQLRNQHAVHLLTIRIDGLDLFRIWIFLAIKGP
ncbi:hypothetical protein D3C74_374220 [compost metagenome]